MSDCRRMEAAGSSMRCLSAVLFWFLHGPSSPSQPIGIEHHAHLYQKSWPGWRCQRRSPTYESPSFALILGCYHNGVTLKSLYLSPVTYSNLYSNLHAFCSDQSELPGQKEKKLLGLLEFSAATIHPSGTVHHRPLRVSQCLPLHLGQSQSLFASLGEDTESLCPVAHVEVKSPQSYQP